MKNYLTLILTLGLVAVSGSASAQINCEAGVDFYPQGGIKSCVLNGNHQVYTHQGVRLVCSNGKAMEQYPNGSLKSCTLDKAQRVQRTSVPGRFEARI